jgi:hypothetical protein
MDHHLPTDVTKVPDHASTWRQPRVCELSPEQAAAVKAIAFLEKFHPNAMWALCSFGPNNEVGSARTFHPSEAVDAIRFIESLQGRFNLYFAVNPVTEKLTKKARKADVAEVRWLHIDADLDKRVDWSSADDVEAEKSRVLTQLRTYNPPPTVITWTGGGFQAFWRLRSPIVVNGDADLMRSAERRMERIEREFDADSCHNADRVMRLPGTLNVLNKSKVAAGRLPTLAEVVEFHDDRVWDLADFPEIGLELSLANLSSATAPRKACPSGSDEIGRMRDALKAIPADDYRVYIKILMAIKSGLGDAGVDMARGWANSSTKFNELEFGNTWASIRPEGGVTVASLFGLARDHGWRDVSTSSVDPTDHADPDMSIVRRNRVEIPKFPVDVFGPATEWVHDTAESKSAPIDYVALGLLTVATAMIGAKRRVSPWKGWEEPSILWGALIGEPSTHKSPALDPLRDAVKAIEINRNADWQERQAEFEESKRIAEIHRKAWDNEVHIAVANNGSPPPMPPEAIMPKVPTRHRAWIADSTTEQVVRILAENPGGVICFRDELAGFLGGFDRYGGSGSDRAFWIECYGGRPHRFDRVGLKGEPNDVPFCAASLLGSLQPDRVANTLLLGDDDGLAARLLYAWPDAVPPRRPTRAPDGDALVAALRRLQDLPFFVSHEGTLHPRVVPLTCEAAEEFEAWWQGKQWQARKDASGKLAGAVGKLDGIALRLSQALEFLDWAWNGSGEPEPQRISLHSMRNALRIIDLWARPNLDRVFGEASFPQAHRDARILGRWLLKTKPETVNARALRRIPGFPGPKDPKSLEAAIELLIDASWLWPTAPPSGAHGRPRKNFDVNPRIYKTQ